MLAVISNVRATALISRVGGFRYRIGPGDRTALMHVVPRDDLAVIVLVTCQVTEGHISGLLCGTAQEQRAQR
jgi:hypothetical protein